MAEDDDKREPQAGDEGAEAGEPEAAPEPPEAPEADDEAADDADEATDARAEAKARVLEEARDKARAKKAAEPESTALAKPDEPERRDLPKWNRARVKRKAPAGEETDAFQKNVRKAGRTALTRAPVLLGIAALIAGGIGGYIWWRNKAEAERADQTRMLAVAAGYQARGVVEPNLDAVMAERARPLPVPVVKDEAELAAKVDGALAGLADAAPDSAANTVADLIRGGRHMRAGAFADAEAAYQRFLQGRPEHELAFLAKEGVLLAREAQGDREGALTVADELAGDEAGHFYRDQALWHKGRLLEALGRADEATKVYRQYAEEYPLEQESVAKDEVIERLRELDPDAVADLPPAPTGMPPGALPPGVLGQ